MTPSLADLNRKYPSATHNIDKYRQSFELVKDQRGDFAEFGVYNGGGSRELSTLDPNRLVWAFDTFNGMPQEDWNNAEDDSDNPPGKWKPDAQPEQLFEGIPNIRPMIGRFVDTLPLVPPGVQFILCHIDCDWYRSHQQVLEFLGTRLAPKAILIFDDPGLHGSKRAIGDWVRNHSQAKWDGNMLTWNAKTNP